MKVVYKLKLALVAICGVSALASCNVEEPFNKDFTIPGLGGESYAETEIDKWLYSNYVQPYNISVEYRWDASEMMSSIDKQLVPVAEEIVIPFMSAMHDVWFEPLELTGGVDFVKITTPKKMVLVGSPEYEFGAIKLGQAEGGRKILLLNVNAFDAADEEVVRSYLHVIEHEYSHILHQLVLFSSSYEKICAGSYTPSGWLQISDAEAYAAGFITPYAMSSKDEDFVEMISMILVYGQEWYEDTVIAGAGSTGAAKLRAKEQIIVSYLRDTWNIDFYDTAESKGLVTYVQEAIDKLLLEAQNEK